MPVPHLVTFRCTYRYRVEKTATAIRRPFVIWTMLVTSSWNYLQWLQSTCFENWDWENQNWMMIEINHLMSNLNVRIFEKCEPICHLEIGDEIHDDHWYHFFYDSNYTLIHRSIIHHAKPRHRWEMQLRNEIGLAIRWTTDRWQMTIWQILSEFQNLRFNCSW